MINSLLLGYTRYFPIEYGKKMLAPFIKMPENIEYVNRYGARFLLDTKEYLMKQIFVYDLYEKNTVKHLVRLIKPEFTFFDVGSNIGFYSLTFAKLMPRGKVHCFEPNQLSFGRLIKNLEINNLENVILNNVGLSDEEKDIESTYNLLNTGTASVYKKKTNNSFTEIIHLTKLDSYCNQRNIDKIDLIKVDIEGGEYAFLKGGESIIKNSKKLIMVVEMMEENFVNAGYTSEEIFDYIINLGFKAYLPKSFPFGLKNVKSLPVEYSDNIIFLRGY